MAIEPNETVLPEVERPTPDWRQLRDQARDRAARDVGQELTKAEHHDGAADKLIVRMRDDLDMTFVDIAARTGLTEALVQKRYRRAKGIDG